jgi:hypothetical protein
MPGVYSKGAPGFLPADMQAFYLYAAYRPPFLGSEL